MGHVKTKRNGTVSFKITVPGPGTLDILETAPHRDFATIATAGPQVPGPGRFVFARIHLVLTGSGTQLITVKPTAKIRKLLRHPARAVRLSLFVTYTPTGGLPLTEPVFKLQVIK